MAPKCFLFASLRCILALAFPLLVGGLHPGHGAVAKPARIVEGWDAVRPAFSTALSSMRQSLANISPGPVAVYTAGLELARFNSSRYRHELTAVSIAPIFGAGDTCLGCAITGGSCITHSTLGLQIGDPLTAAVRAGRAAGMPVLAGTASLWQTHREASWTFLGMLLLLILLVAALLVERMRRRRAERSLREAEERMTLAVQAGGLGMWAWQAGGDGIPLTPRCRRLCGFGTDHAMGRAEGCTGVDAEVCPMLADAIGQLTVASPTFETECLHGVEEQKPCWIASRGRGYFGKDGRLERIIGVSMDVTERKNSARSLQEQRDQLAHVGRVSIMGQLASSLAHELNQPLGAILRNAEAAELFLNEAPPNLEELRAILADIRQDDERAGAVIDRMKALLKRREFQLGLVALPKLVEEVVSLAEPDATARQVQLVVKLAPDPPLIMGDRVQLQQVLLNLVINGIDAVHVGSSPARRVVVTSVNAVGHIEVSVSDSGPGIPPEVLPRVFEPFFTTKENGMGVGLAICRTIIEVHGGKIWGENDPDGGAVFRFSLPVSMNDDRSSAFGRREPAGSPIPVGKERSPKGSREDPVAAPTAK